MSKQLSLKAVKKENEIYKEKFDIPVKVDGVEYNIKITPFFSPEKIKNVINSFSKLCKMAVDENIEIKNGEDFSIIDCLLIKEFTDIKFSNNRKASTILAEFKQLLNSPLYRELMEAFPESSVHEAYGYYNDMKGVAVKFERFIEQQQEMVNKLPLENKDILFGDKSDKES
ncbi:hypothetical protein [Priestia aryabhattai]|uniref:hypothetical protein n=1 Tax=Priestia aryabhattai TaxID=412384 RepID=UPI0015F63071|nr:hypothetical protein [Priestia aryabhattai]